MSKTPIQWHVISDSNLPSAVAGDHVYFTEKGIYVPDGNGEVKKCAGNYDQQLNGFRVYTFSDLGIGYNSEISDIINAMPNKSILICAIEGSNIYPTQYGVLIIVKLSGYRTRLTYTSYQNNDLYYANYSASAGLTSWKKTADTQKGTISLLNGWVKEFGNLSIAKVGNIVSFNLNLKSGSTTVGTNIARLPEGLRPTEGFLEDYICYDSNWNTTVGTLWVNSYGYITIPEGNTVYNNRLILNSSFVV